MAEVSLSGGGVALVDDIDLQAVLPYTWHARRADHRTYAYGKVNGRPTFMHRLITGELSMAVDHVNGDGLDNRRANLRLATNGQNRANSRPTAASGFKGVSRSGNRWRAYGMKHRQQTYLGSFASAEEAARAYDAWAIEAHGEFARLNFPLDRVGDKQAQGANQP
jgi:hypothetical protein